MRFQHSIYTCCLDKWRLVDAELNAGAELDAMNGVGGMPAGGRAAAAAPVSGSADTDELLRGSRR